MRELLCNRLPVLTGLGMEMTNSVDGDAPGRNPDSISRATDLLLDIGALLMVSGAHCGRVRRNVARVAETWGYDLHLFMSFTGITVPSTRSGIRNGVSEGSGTAGFLRSTSGYSPRSAC